jgi:hypothetical protein
MKGGVYVTCYIVILYPCNMKLYWRVKIGNKWTYKAADMRSIDGHGEEIDNEVWWLVKELKE